MTAAPDDTIVAIASPTAPAPRGIVRVSGGLVPSIVSGLRETFRGGNAAWRSERSLDLAEPIGTLPASFLVWPGRRSYTGEPSLEIHLIGSLPVLQAAVDRVVGLGARPARPGEFTMRAFLAGRLDLTQAEAVLGVIEAETRGALDHALRQLGGNLSVPLERLRSGLLDLLADVEAGLDFVDEDIEFVTDDAIVARLDAIAGTLRQTSDRLRQRGGGTDRVRVALLGDPNAGKSRLFNRLVGSEAAIVADVSGTTRDTVTADVTLGGTPARLVDTAGLDPEASGVGGEAQGHAVRTAEESDVRLWCVDLGRPDRDRHDAIGRVQAAARHRRGGQLDLWVGTKRDLANSPPPAPWIATHSNDPSGIEPLTAALAATLADRDREESGSVVGTAARSRESIRGAIDAVEAARRLAATGQGHEWVAAELRAAAGCVGEVTGAVYTDDILDRVFGRFCIGK